jgi:hypothetical protein
LVIEIGSKLLHTDITKEQAEWQMQKAIELAELGELNIAETIIFLLHDNSINTEFADKMFKEELKNLSESRISQAAEESAEALTLDRAHVDLSAGLPSSSGGTDLSLAITEHGAHALSASDEACLRAKKIQ